MKANLSWKRTLLTFAAFGVIAGAVLLLAACAGAPGAAGPAGPAGAAGPAGPAGPLAPGTERQLDGSVTVSKPANGTHFVAGEQAVLTITLKDQTGAGFDRANDFSQLRLMLAGPQAPVDTVTAVKLLKTSADRSQPVHHYVDLIKNADVQASGTTLTYKLASVSDEKPGTYVASVWAVEKAAPLQQVMVSARLQIGTATVEKDIVNKTKCAACHLGADSGKFYFAHIDVGFSPVGNPSLDQNAPDNCITCHNNDGYSAYADPSDSKKQIVDQLVKRVHGVHMGEGLTNPTNTDPTKGIFANYTGIRFPANVKNCTACHVDDAWKTKPSQLACGACHDNTWFGDIASMPKTAVSHQGGPQPDNSLCATCHPPDTGGLKPVAEAHKIKQVLNKIDVTLTAPRNGKYFAGGERPQLTLVIRNDAGNPIDHTLVGEATFSTANFYVYGPRENSVPVLTNTAKNANSKARASVSSSIPATQQSDKDPTKGWTFIAGDTFKIAIHGAPAQELAAPTGLQTPAQVVAWLTANLSKDLVISANAAGNVNILSKIQGDKSRFDIYNSAVTAKMGWKPLGLNIIEKGKVVGQMPGVTVEPYVVIGNVSTAAVDMRQRSDPLNYTDPLVTRTYANITYMLDDVASLTPGTYMIYSYVIPNGVVAGTAASPGPAGSPVAATKAMNVSQTGVGFMTFQVGTETPDKKIATNCNDCHQNQIWHLDEGPIHPEPFDTDYCKACHDYNRSGTGESFAQAGGTSTSGFFGYGAKPLVARLHGVHRGVYLTYPEYIYAGNPNAFNEVVFPQDIRNCTKCHSADTTGTWKTAPGRLACMSCHDSDAANTHAILMTSNPTPADPWNTKRVETCNTCHGAGKEFSPDKVHNISNPYKPPYPREPEK